MDPLAAHRGRELDEAAYLRAIEELDLEGVAWDAGNLAEVRDFLGPWHHNIRLPHGVHTAYWEAPYPAHEEMMRVVARELRGGFAGKRVLDLGCLEGYFAVECALQGATVVAIDGKIKNLVDDPREVARRAFNSLFQQPKLESLRFLVSC